VTEVVCERLSGGARRCVRVTLDIDTLERAYRGYIDRGDGVVHLQPQWCDHLREAVAWCMEAP